MLKRKIVLFLVVLMAVVIVSTPEKIYAGTCSCFFQDGDLYVDDSSNTCDITTEKAVCSDGTPNCGCVNRETGAVVNTGLTQVNTGGIPVNTCNCQNMAVAQTNCQGSTPYATCDKSGCVCSATMTGGVGKNPFTGCTSSSINTALGCIPVEMEKFVPWLLGWLFGVAGGIAFLLMAYGFILIATSAGDEKKVQGARETITSAVIGLLVCVFSIFILRLIAVNILQIPGIN